MNKAFDWWIKLDPRAQNIYKRFYCEVYKFDLTTFEVNSENVARIKITIEEQF